MGASKTATKLRRASTYRLEPELQAKLDSLSELTQTTRNHLVNEAVGEYISRRSETLELDLNALLAKVKLLKRLDPTYEKTIQANARAEAELSGDDPAEGTVYERKPARALKGR